MALTVSPPWLGYARRLRKLFEYDDQVRVQYIEDGPIVKLYVDNTDKADALDKLLPDTVEFGGVTLVIEVVPANAELTVGQLFEKAFQGNDAVSDILSAGFIEDAPFTYVLFEPTVVQYYNDNAGSYFGIETTTYEDIAKEVFNETPGVLMGTDVMDAADTNPWPAD